MNDIVPSNNVESTPKPRGFQKGNPGRPKGARNKATVLAERLMEKDVRGITNVVVEQALAGDLQAAKLVLDRVAPPPKGRRVSFSMPLIPESCGYRRRP